MEVLLEFILKYWIEFLLAGVSAFLVAKYRKLKNTLDIGKNTEYKEKLQKDLEPFKNQIKEEIEENVETVKEKQNNMEQDAEDRMKMYLEHEQNILNKIKELTDISDERKEMYLEHEKEILEKVSEVMKMSDQRKEMYFEHEKGIFDKIDDIEQKFTESISYQNDKIDAIDEKFTKSLAEQIQILDKNSQERGEESRKRDEMTLHAVLYLQKKEFLHNCEKLLDSDHVITFDEYGTIQKDYELYKGLGGNGQGDTYMKAIEQKYQTRSQKS